MATIIITQDHFFLYTENFDVIRGKLKKLSFCNYKAKWVLMLNETN